jgi:antitoxin component of RelBE/YafQ-DinJ toxin-antitoxin module
MATVKDNRIYVRLSSDVKKEFELVAAYQGLTPSAMLHSFIVKTVREAKEQSPQIFKSSAKETENKAEETEKSDKVITLGEAKADNKKKKGDKK